MSAVKRKIPPSEAADEIERRVIEARKKGDAEPELKEFADEFGLLTSLRAIWLLKARGFDFGS